MSNCIYCTKPAGLLKKFHKECQVKFNNGKLEIIELSKDASINKKDIKYVKQQISDIATNSFISEDLISELIIEGWEKSVEEAFEDGILTEEEENILSEVAEGFSSEPKTLDKNGYYSKMVKGAVLREVMEGKIPNRIKVGGTIPFNFQKDEN